MGTKCRNQVFYVWLVDLQTICIKYGVETWFSPNDDFRICLFDKQHSRTKNAFWILNYKKWRKMCKFVLLILFKNISGLPVLRMGTKCPNQVFYVWLVDLQTIALNTGRNVIRSKWWYSYVCSTFSVVELKTRFETWITRNDVNDVNLFLFSYLITLMLYMCSGWVSSVLLVVTWLGVCGGLTDHFIIQG
jgi:hypothetical protein